MKNSEGKQNKTTKKVKKFLLAGIFEMEMLLSGTSRSGVH
jgi:hypothetical protein